MEAVGETRRIAWYRSPIARGELNELNQRSDCWGLLQTLGHLGVLATTAGAWYAAEHLWWPWLFSILFLYGTCYVFLLNGFRELCHSTVFKSKFLNYFFLRLFSFLGAYNHVHFWASHAEHHKYTLHPPDDLEVVLPTNMRLMDFLRAAIVNPWGLKGRYQGIWRHARGQLVGEWELAIFPESDPHKRWHMNYHIEHHMYAAVPCYRLGKLHETIKDDLPHTTVGLYAAWKEIVGILKRQQEEPDYEYVPELPVRPAMA